MLLSWFGYLGRQRISRYRVMQLGGFSWLDRFSVSAGRMGFGKTWMPACARTWRIGRCHIPTVKDKSLEEMASDLRSLSGQIVTARVMGVGHGGVGNGVAGGDANNDAGAPAVRLVGDMLAAELSRTLEQLSARQREDMASLVLNHAQGMRATTDRVDRLLRGIEADRERDDSVDAVRAGTAGRHRRPAG